MFQKNEQKGKHKCLLYSGNKKSFIMGEIESVMNLDFP